MISIVLSFCPSFCTSSSPYNSKIRTSIKFKFGGQILYGIHTHNKCKLVPIFRRVACNQPAYWIDVSDHIFHFWTLTRKRFVQSNSNLTGT